MDVIRWYLEQEAKLLGLAASPLWILECEMALLAEQVGVTPGAGL